MLQQLPYLRPIIGDRAGQQFTPADPVVVVGFGNADLAVRTQPIDVRISIESLDLERGYKVLVQQNSASNIRSVEAIDMRAFRRQMRAMFQGVDTNH